MTGYSIATTSVNLGDVNLEWSRTTTATRIPQNMFRFKDGRLDQIGMSGKDGRVSQESCGPCQPADWVAPASRPRLLRSLLRPLNGQQSGLAAPVQRGDRILHHPLQNLPSAPATVGRRLQVLQADLALDEPRAAYYCDSIYLHRRMPKPATSSTTPARGGRVEASPAPATD